MTTTKLLAALALALSLAACGSEAEEEPAAVQPIREVCTVRLLPDGQVICECVRVQPQP